MLFNILEQNYFTSMFFIISVVAVVVLVVLEVLLRVHYKKINKANESEEKDITRDDLLNEVEEQGDVLTVTESLEDTLEASEETQELTTSIEEVQDEAPVITETLEESKEDIVETLEQEEETITSVVEKVQEEDEPLEPVTLEPVTDEDTLETDLTEVLEEETTNDVVLVERYRKSFIAKMILDKNLQDIYKELRDHIMSYKKVKARLSFKYERFSIGRKALVKLVVRGKKLYLYLALNPLEQEPKYHLVDVSNKKIGEQLPSLLKVLSDRSVKYAKLLIDKLMLENELTLLPEEKIVHIDYNELLRKRSLDKLIEDGLVVKYLAKDVSFGSSSSDDLTPEELSEITPEKAEELVDTQVMKEKVEYIKKSRSGKQAIVNIGDLSYVFNDGDYVDLEVLIRKGLIPRNSSRVKVLANGTLDKTLVVEADDFSQAAMKMILYKNGRILKVK